MRIASYHLRPHEQWGSRMSNFSSYSTEGAQCPKCGTIAEDDDNWITKHGGQYVDFNCEGCGTPLEVTPDFSVNYYTFVRGEPMPQKGGE